MNRCPSKTINNKRCRAIIKDNNLFCCKGHEPINKDIIDNGCFMCMEKIEKSNDILFLKCNHAFHKSCYFEWLQFSTYENPICIICRSEVFQKKEKEIKKKEVKYITDITPIQDIMDSLFLKKKCICCFNIENYEFIPHTPDISPPQTPKL